MTAEEEIKTAILNAEESFKNIYPDPQTFLEYARPFFEPVYPDYEKYLAALKKIGIENIETIIQFILGPPRESLLKNRDSILENINKELVKITAGENLDELSATELYKKVMGKISFQNTIPYMSVVYEDIRLEQEEKCNELNEKGSLLSEQEDVIIGYFNLLILKLYLCYTFQNPAFYEIIPQAYQKQFLLNYFSEVNALYSREVVPTQLIDHIKSIKIPDEEKLLAEFLEPFEKTSNSMIPKNISVKPLFHQQAEIFTELKKHFNGQQHPSLKQIFTGENSGSHPKTEKLLFLGNSNQLADVFRGLYNAQLITGCSKEELIKWICNNFQYRNKTKARDFKEKYLHDIISAEQKPCKKPIIKILETNDGKKIIVSTTIQPRQKQ